MISGTEKICGICGTKFICGTMGLSGTASSALFEVLGMNPLALLSIRLIVSSALMLILFRPKFPGSDLKLFAIYVATTFILQLSYLETIDLSNAPTV